MNEWSNAEKSSIEKKESVHCLIGSNYVGASAAMGEPLCRFPKKQQLWIGDNNQSLGASISRRRFLEHSGSDAVPASLAIESIDIVRAASAKAKPKKLGFKSIFLFSAKLSGNRVVERKGRKRHSKLWWGHKWNRLRKTQIETAREGFWCGHQIDIEASRLAG